MDSSFTSSHEKQQFAELRQALKQIEKESEHQQIDTFPEILDQANPILPPGSYSEISNPTKFRYRFLSDKNKLNRTAFPGVKSRNWNTIGTGNSDLPSLGKTHYKHQNPEIEDNEIQHQFKEMLECKILVYKRINNDLLNQVGFNRSKIYCSVFFNAKSIDYHSGEIPVFEHISKKQSELSRKNIQFPYYQKDQPLVFDSAFESGNLFAAFKSLDSSNNLPTYELYLQNDTNTKGCTQWFYFSVVNRIKGKIKLRLMNFYKPTSLYSRGMKVLCSKNQKEWKRTGTAIEYERLSLNEERCTFYLDFIHQFDGSMEPVYFCYGFPYSYTQNLGGMLKELITENNTSKRFIRKEVLCQSNMGNNIYILTINDNVFKPQNKKPIIYIIARQHPGETPASFIVQGLIKFLISNKLEAEELRNAFNFRIVPLVNVDGTISGNYRSNCSGNDVNRQWDFPSKKLHPQIFHLKRQILTNKKRVSFFLDIHAHSRKQNVIQNRMNSFFYGNKASNNDNKFYPFVCSKLCKFINYEDCAFCEDPSKKSTARVVIQTQLNLKNSLTFQCSFYGWQDQAKNNKHHFKVKDFQYIGESLGLGLFYSEITIKKSFGQKLQESNRSPIILQNKQSPKAGLLHKITDKVISNRQQLWKNIEKNSQRIYLKWKKMQEYEKNVNEDQAFSEGSSIEPEHFQLQQEEEQTLQQMFSKQLIRQEKQENRQTLSITINQDMISSNLMNKPEGRSKSTKNTPNHRSFEGQTMTKNGQDWIYKGDNEEIMVYPRESNLRNSMVVKQLQSQLQIYKKKHESDIVRSSKIDSFARNSQYKSLSPQTTLNYRYNIVQMKKALRYFLESKDHNKNTDYDQYQLCFKNVSQHDSMLSFKERLSHKRNFSKRK